MELISSGQRFRWYKYSVTSLANVRKHNNVFTGCKVNTETSRFCFVIHTFEKKSTRVSSLKRHICLILTVLILHTGMLPAGAQGPDPIAAEIEMIRNRAVDYARQFTGISYKYAGRRPESGFDCSGFTSFVLASIGVALSPGSRAQVDQGAQVHLLDARPGDLLFFGDSSAIQHVAMVVRSTPEAVVCIHSTTARGVIEENILRSSYWMTRYLYARDVISGSGLWRG
jgi:cell wall-associated NlpC family hydrolase